MMYELSRAEARRIAVRAQRLSARRPASLNEAVRALTLLQIDSTAAVAPSADLVAWSRLGSSYSPDQLDAARAERSVVELRGMIRPSGDIALYQADMDSWPGTGELSPWQQIKGDWVAANDAFRRDILARLSDQGPLAAADLPDTSTIPWRSSGWNNKRNVGQMLEMMEERGEIAVACRRHGRRQWDVASRVYPDVSAVPADEARRRRNDMRLRSLGLARSRGPECRVEPDDVGSAGQPAVVEGVRGEWRVDPTYLDGEFEGRTAVLSPLDRSIFDRKRMAEIFRFDYQLEMYKPKVKRRWGYYALPILHGDRFVGKIDAAADRKSGVLRIDAVHEDEPFGRPLRDDVQEQMDDLARCLQLDVRMAC